MASSTVSDNPPGPGGKRDHETNEIDGKDEKTKSFSVYFVCFVISLLLASPAFAQNPPVHIASYKIDAQLKLDEKGRPSNIEGREQLTWLNDSPDAIDELRFHLYLNAFKNDKSSFFRQSGGQLRGDYFKEGEWGWIEIKQIKLGAEDLTSRLEFIHPDDDNADDQTVIRIPLSKPVRPNEKVLIEIQFVAKLPRVYARTGYWGRFALVAQWFPKIGVWESVGERRRTQAGWNCHQFHADSEFYADFGIYDVTMTVPAIYRGKIGATGAMKSERVNPDGTVTCRFYQEAVHDFAWTVDPDYIVVKRYFKADERVSQSEIDEWSKRLNLPPERMRLGDIEVTLLIQPEHREQIDRHFTAVFNAVKYFGLWYGKYPYGTLTVVDPPYNASGAGGMEYPTFITAGTSWRAGDDDNPEEVIVHEFGHQYWQGMAANNEFEESWLDEGFNTYSTAKVMKAAYGSNVFPLTLLGVNWFYFPAEVPRPFEDRILTLRGKFKDPILTPAWKYYDSLSYSLNSYPRTGLVLNTLERYLGEDVFARVMREYHEKWRFRHPASQDFFDEVNRVTGHDLSWYFDQFVRGTGTLDYELADYSSRKVESGFENEATVIRLGEAWMPIDILFTLKDGGRITAAPVMINDGIILYKLNDSKGGEWSEYWPIKDRWKKFKFNSSSELLRAQIDPHQKILLDANLTNNSKTDDLGVAAGLRWGSGAMFWIQAALQAISCLS